MEIINLLKEIEENAAKHNGGRYDLQWSLFVKDINRRITEGIQNDRENITSWSYLFTYLVLWSQLLEIKDSLFSFFKRKSLEYEINDIKNFILADTIITGE